ncbi:hypothetical protein [Nocardia abscessus]|uniref:hypothetical protein n=1 Tax=Nocardia abscessus TaxID=120957 RepID=UPI00245387E8|nr:hypothetical protein [Nocardia abscessus]
MATACDRQLAIGGKPKGDRQSKDENTRLYRAPHPGSVVARAYRLDRVIAAEQFEDAAVQRIPRH